MYDKSLLLEMLRDDCRTLDNNGKPYPPGAPVYALISQKMHENNSNITAKHVYTIMNEDRNEYRKILQQHYNINTDTFEKNIDDTFISENSINSINTSTSSIATYSKEFNLVISADKWQMIKPIKKMYNQRVYWVLKSGWTDIIAEKLWQQQKLPCVFKFKKHNVCVSAQARCYISFQGSCTECAATIAGILFKVPSDDTDVIFQCTVKNICSVKHVNKKRYLKGKRRALIADKMIEQRKDAIFFRREEATRLKQFGDKDPPILSSSAVLRKAKEERLLQQHGLIFSNPILNLLNSAKHSKYMGSIIHISLLPFFCIYWTPE